MTVSQNSNILIQGNTFDVGNDSITGRISYTNIIALNLDPNAASDLVDSNGPGYAVVDDNYLSGIAIGGTHIVVNSGSANITNNTFIGPGSIQDGTAIAAYINVSGSQMDQIITNNFFDSPTVDMAGTNEQLVIGPGTGGALTPNSIYTNNKNQTSYLPISKAPNLVYFDFFPNSAVVSATSNPTQNFYFYDSFPASGGTSARFRSKYGSFSAAGTPVGFSGIVAPYYIAGEGTQVNWEAVTTETNVRYLMTIDVDEYLPANVQILNFVIGLNATSNDNVHNLAVLAGTANSMYQLQANSSLSKNPNVAYSPTGLGPTNISTALANSVADVKTTIASGPPVGSEVTTHLTVVPSAPGANQVTPAQLAATTQYLFIDVSTLPQYYTVTPNTRISVTYQAETEADATVAGVTANGYINVFESPLIVKYRW